MFNVKYNYNNAYVLVITRCDSTPRQLLTSYSSPSSFFYHLRLALSGPLDSRSFVRLAAVRSSAVDTCRVYFFIADHE